MTLDKWRQELTDNFEETVKWRRHLHEHPEPSFEEVETAKYIVNQLKAMGIEDIRTHVGNGYGIVAKIKGKHPGPTVALRADFDALRVTEEVDSVFRSKYEGFMHACGHDGHTASLLSVAKVLMNNQHELHGTVVLLHQHAEEVLPGGAKSMVEDGALEDVDYVFGIHLGAEQLLNQVYYNYGFGSANSDTFTLKVQGKGGHGAAPHDTHDALTVGTQIVSGLQQIVSRLTDPVKPAVLTFAGFQSGGEAYNIIADSAEIFGTVRTMHQDVQQMIEAKLKSMSSQIAAAYDATVEIDYTQGYPSIQNTPEEVEKVKEAFLSVFPKDEVEEVEGQMGGEDFAYFLLDKPGAFLRVGAKPPENEVAYPHHHPKFEIDEQALLRSGEVFLTIIDQYLTH
ncbi:amidohydrolase [Alkalibacterium putridalgicola]|uniref:Amidohydrolase n=1 Tax=Alkalibacterium putridalgicola TaxID=426703 RepID=A0A1H7R062_9LACT|nr:amidohydrolase [Alkalibacterium putridalgicola]GEK88997.1 putative amidohydrolase YhaA [Alkalibacterium putridalgicola]SEL52937.1 amidohydrolase [Alkalibacterium putridalgicola]